MCVCDMWVYMYIYGLGGQASDKCTCTCVVSVWEALVHNWYIAMSCVCLVASEWDNVNHISG